VATYVLIHGAASDAWYWHRVVPELRAWGHDVVTPNLPSDDESAGFPEYADAVVNAIGERRDLILVAQSLGGFTAPLVCERLPVELLVMVAAMVPRPGESGEEWWTNTRYAEAKTTPFDVMADFFHDVPPDVVAEAMKRGEREQAGTPMEDPWPLAAWPSVPTRFLLCRDDRFFPAGFMRRVVRDRLGITPDEIEGGHLPALARPRELVARLEQYRLELNTSSDGERHAQARNRYT
jgi:pimeloyl-ACP methyl ester carboxylesterase